MPAIEFDGGPLDGQQQTHDVIPDGIAALGPLVGVSSGIAYGYTATDELRDGRVVFRYTGQTEESIIWPDGYEGHYGK